jgi:hypothetical protein
MMRILLAVLLGAGAASQAAVTRVYQMRRCVHSPAKDLCDPGHGLPLLG